MEYFGRYVASKMFCKKSRPIWFYRQFCHFRVSVFSLWFQSFTFFIKSTWNVLVDTSHPKCFCKIVDQFNLYRQFCHFGVSVFGFRKLIIDPKIILFQILPPAFLWAAYPLGKPPGCLARRKQLGVINFCFAISILFLQIIFADFIN